MRTFASTTSALIALVVAAASCGSGDISGSSSDFSVSMTVNPTKGRPPLTVNAEIAFKGPASQDPVSLRLSCGMPEELNPEIVTKDNPYRMQCVYTDIKGGNFSILAIAKWQGKTATATSRGITVMPVPPPGAPALEDRPDEVSGRQVHGVYIFPLDKQPRGVFYLTTDALMALSSSVRQQWLAKQTGGLYMQMDTHQRFLDITLVHSQYTDKEVAALGKQAGNLLVKDMIRAKLNDTTKTYLVYADFSNPETCSASSVNNGVNMAIIFLQGMHDDTPCIYMAFLPSDPDLLRLWQYWELRELFHALGYVDPAAPHYDGFGGVTDSPNDLMRNKFDMPVVLDFGKDDYCGDKVPQGVRNCLKDPIMVKAQ